MRRGGDGPLCADCGEAGDSIHLLCALPHRDLRFLSRSFWERGHETQKDVGRCGSPSLASRCHATSQDIIPLILSMKQHQASRIYGKGSATGDYEARPPWVSCADILDPHHRSVWDSNGWSWSFKVLNISFVVQSTTELGLRRVWRRSGTRRY